MKEHPILYSTPMIRAKLEGRKFQTRRIIKVQPEAQLHPCGSSKWYWSTDPSDLKIPYVKCPYGKVGDVLWARETWCSVSRADCVGGVTTKYHYKADYEDTFKWKPSIHMPKEASRIWERITDIRVERLQDISEEDAIAEGVGCGFQMNSGWPDYTRIVNGLCEVTQDCARMSYATLWESINGEGSWDLSPWVWVIETEILSTTGRPSGLAVSKTEK